METRTGAKPAKAANADPPVVYAAQMLRRLPGLTQQVSNSSRSAELRR